MRVFYPSADISLGNKLPYFQNTQCDFYWSQHGCGGDDKNSGNQPKLGQSNIIRNIPRIPPGPIDGTARVASRVAFTSP